jgi:hypothetical protein
VTTKRIVREEGDLREAEEVLSYKKQRYGGISGSILHFFRGYIFVRRVKLSFSPQIREGCPAAAL